MAMQQLRVVVFQEEGAWVAQCLEYDIGAQAPDLNTLPPARADYEMALLAA